MPHATLDPATVGVLGVPNYTHGIASAGTTRWLHLSGQVGLRPDGSVAADALGQCRQSLANIGALLEAGGMAAGDIVHMRVFLIDRADLDALRQARGEFLGDRKVASTLVYVSGLVDPSWKVEIEVVAAK
ncbi:RidA family protein [Thalassobaculum sp.]|uniref:RidA family protein n=1 Tax=Thalassobaculum sp. TaxID=2022740 RepID=UPI0032ED1099